MGGDISLFGLADLPETSQWAEQFEHAIAAARAGDYQLGRELCASALLDAQPLLARSERQLRIAVTALLLSGCFKLLSRLVAALTGNSVRVALVQSRRASDAPLRCHEDMQGPIVMVDSRWLADLSVSDPFLVGWCQELASGKAYVGNLQSQVQVKSCHIPV